MSQILRLTGRWTVTTFRNKERNTICESCFFLRNGYRELSTQTKFDPNIKFFRKMKKKKLPNKKELHQQLVRILDATLHQPSTSSRKRNQHLESEVPNNARTEFSRLDKHGIRLGNQKTGKSAGQQASAGSLQSEHEDQFSSDQLSKYVDNEQILHANYSSVIPNKVDTNHVLENEFDNVKRWNNEQTEPVKNQMKDGSQNQHKKNLENLKKDQNTAKQNQKLVKKDVKLKKVSKKKKNKAEINEVYGRKSKKIHDKKEKVKRENEKHKEKNVIVNENIYEKSMVHNNLNIIEFDEGLKETKALFKYKPDELDHYLPKVSYNDTDENIEKSEDVDEASLIHGEESTKDVLDDVVEGVELGKDGKDWLPDAEWAVLKAIRKKKDSPKALTVEEWGKLEMMQDVFHEDTTIDQDIQYDHIVSDWAPDVKHIEGMLTQKAQKILKEKQNKEKWKLLKVNEDLIQHTKQEIFNQDLLSYVEACVCVGITDRALEDVKMYRAKNEEEYKITDVGIYNLILRGLGKEEKGLHKVREVFSYIREDGLNPTLETYMICLSCIGKSSDYDVMMASFIVKDIMDEGLDVKDIFNQCTFLYNERSKVYQILTEVIPDFEPNPPVVDVMYSGDLVEPLNETLPHEEKVEVNPFTCGLSKQEIMYAAEEQFGRELDGITTVSSIFKTNTPMDARKKEAIGKIQEEWRKQIKEAFLKRKSKLRLKAYKTQGINIYPFMCLFPDDDYVKILCEELHCWLLFSKMYSPSCAYLRKSLINRMRQRFSVQQMIEMDVFPKLYKTYSTYISHLINPEEQVKTQRELWKQAIQDVSDGNSMKRPFVEWSESVRLTIGDIFFDLIVENTKFDINIQSSKPRKMVDAFLLVERSRDGKRNLEVRPHPAITLLVDAQADLIMPTDTLPSLCPPVPFLAPMQGGNFISTVDLVRWCTDQQIEILKERTEEAGPVLDSINVLSTYAWKLNKPVLDVALKVFKEGGNSDLEIPILPENILKPAKLDASASHEEKIEYNKQMFTYKKSVSEAVSQWWSGLYKLSIANQLRDRTFWLVMNLDFRGRSYPVAPHLHHQNQDYVKALLIFAKGKPLGEKGFDWLKLHLVNLTEHKKRASFEERLSYADKMIPEILDSADNPLHGNKWWMTSENPWQTLAACKEVAKAIRSGNPSTFVSHYPVHQDGSCNGLQHYAALGRDVTGARSVNLKQDGDTPADIYSDVVDLVRKEIEYDIEHNTSDYKIAKICEPYLERKVIKQSIMTTVYGVTMYGAKLQIQRQLGYKEFPHEHILVGSRYLAEKTFKCLNNLFTSARQIQEWFDECSVAISKVGQAVEWKTPLNLLCIQPYYKSRLQPPDMPDKIYNYLIRKTHSLRVADVNKQKNGFAPNFIHSLDSTHMMLTSLYCYRKGITYASVHDSFWTHPCDVDIMNKITREQFIALHNQPILPDLSNYFVDRYIHRGDLNVDQHVNLLKIFTNVPKTGEFDLNEIQQSQYFFS